MYFDIVQENFRVLLKKFRLYFFPTYWNQILFDVNFLVFKKYLNFSFIFQNLCKQVKKAPKNIVLIDYWYLDDFFEEFMLLCCMIFISSRQYSTKADDDTHLTGMVLL
jgi:hypothetical protein